MFAYRRATPSDRDATFALPSDELRIAVTFKRAGGTEGPTTFSPPLSLSSATQFHPDPLAVDRAIDHLSRLGFRPTRRGTLTVSIRGKRDLFERTFSTKLAEVRLDPTLDYAFQSFYYPPQGASFRCRQISLTSSTMPTSSGRIFIWADARASLRSRRKPPRRDR